MYEEEEPGPDFWEMLDNPPAHCEPVAHLYNWAFSQEWGTITLFADLIGCSEEEFGERLWIHDARRLETLGYLELSYLADALQAYAHYPEQVRHYTAKMLRAEVER